MREIDEILRSFQAQGNPNVSNAMAQYGIKSAKIYGVAIPILRNLAKTIGKDHDLAQRLWKINARETRILASMVANPEVMTECQMDDWVRLLDNWEVCDQCCMNLFKKTPYAYQKSIEWSSREEEFVKRAGFVLMACIAVSDKTAENAVFTRFFPIIIREASDPRNFVKKAVNWALRQIGKRNTLLNCEASKVAYTLQKKAAPSARWIANDALHELTSSKIQNRLREKENKA